MTPQFYPLAPSTWGAGVEIPVDHVVQAALFSDFPGLRGTAYVPVVLEANPLNGSWRVRRLNEGALGPVLGEVAPQWRQHYPDIERVHAAFHRPTTVAAVRLDPARGLYGVDLYLPQPQLAVPRNNAPAAATVLPAGDMLVVDTAVGEFSAGELATLSPGQWLVGLQLDDDSASHVLIILNGRVLGALAGADAAAVSAWLEQHDAGNLWARAVIVDAMVGLDVGSPDEGAGHVPAIAEPTRAARPWQVIEFPSGGWAITVERDSAIDPGDVVKPRHTARYVSLKGAPRPEELGAPTEMFGRVDTHERPDRAGALSAQPARLGGEREYLTEVEKVRLRRSQRKRGRGGRHRR